MAGLQIFVDAFHFSLHDLSLLRPDRWVFFSVRLHNPQAAPNIQDYHEYRPIPQTQIDRTEGAISKIVVIPELIVDMKIKLNLIN